MPKGRPGGNPNITDYAFEQIYDWGESCNDKVFIRFPASWDGQIPAGWQEECRKELTRLKQTGQPETRQFKSHDGLTYRTSIPLPTSWKPLPKGWQTTCRLRVAELIAEQIIKQSNTQK